MRRVLVVDNYDSFTYNLVQAFLATGAEVVVRYNDDLDVTEAESIAPTHLVVSPGPGGPAEAGVSVEMIRHFAPRIPVLGVCLGHQAIAVAYGAEVGPALTLMHGKASQVYHDRRSVFAGLPSPLTAGRYHSLAVVEESLPGDLSITAYTSDGEIMGLRHVTHQVEGVQFHPESILTPHGERMIANFLEAPVRAGSI
ncbi:MAG: aminodeoxychorismate/anthranilate synthase component II [Actinobacteria bacterium]|nr:aminodeoxychorismate/anthranilate synthase component II [Actinomycetota bacterium]MCI0677682.1 aminodeoxychorismate/anthranilate synthase component II [Actinomycetota bacterium]